MPSDGNDHQKINKTKKYGSNEIVVNNKSNFKSHLVKCQAIMDNVNFEQCVIKAMGRATTRAINLALELNSNNYETFKLIPQTYTVQISEQKGKNKTPRGANRDAFDPDQVDISAKTLTHVPAIKIVVRKNELELIKICKAKKQGKIFHPADLHGSR